MHSAKYTLMSRSKTLFTFVGIILSLVGFLGVKQVFAASVYNVVEESATVGTAGTFEIEYTVDTAQQTWANGDTLTISVPQNLTIPSLSLTAEYDTDTTNNGVGETAIAVGSGNGQYSITNNQLVTVKWNLVAWGGVMNNASTIRLLITATPVYESLPATFTFGGTTADGADVNPSGTDTLTINAADAAVSATLSSNSVVGVTGPTTLTFTLPVRMTSGDTVVFTVPDHFLVTPVAFSSETFAGLGSFSGCSSLGQVVTCTANGQVGPGTGNLIMTGITPRYAATGQSISSLVVNDSDNGGADIARDASGAITDVTPGTLLNADVQPLILVYAAESPHRISFTTNAIIPQGGKIQVVYPAGFNISGANGQTAVNLGGFTGTWTAAVAGQTLTLTQTDGNATTVGEKIVAVPGILAPSTYAGGSYQIFTMTAAGALVEQALTVEQDFFLPGSKSQEVVLGGVSEFTVTLNSEAYPVLTWVDPSAAFTFSIDVFKQTHPESAYYFARVNSGVQSYTDLDVLPGQTVTYFLRASHPDGVGAFSEEITVLIPVYQNEEVVHEEAQNESEPEVTPEPELETPQVEELEESVSEESDLEEESLGETFFQDIETHESRKAVDFLAQNEIFLGNPDGNFRPDAYLNRAEMAMVLYRLLGSPHVSSTGSVYEDVLSGAWYFEPINALYELDYLSSSLRVYQPNRSMTRNEFMTQLLQMEGALDVDVSALCSLGWCEGNDLLTRAQAAEILYVLFESKLSLEVQD